MKKNKKIQNFTVATITILFIMSCLLLFYFIEKEANIFIKTSVYLFHFGVSFLLIYFVVHKFSTLRKVPIFRNFQNENSQRTKTHSHKLLKLKRKKKKLIQKIHSYKKQRKKIQNRQRFHNDLYKSVQEGIAIIDENFTIQYCNQTMQQIFDNRKLIQTSFLSLFDTKNQKIIKAQLQQKGITTIYELSYQPINNEIKYFRIFTTPLKKTKWKKENSVCTILDITEEKIAKEELNNYKNHLEAIVQQRTEELVRTNDLLQVEIEEREAAEKIIREQKQSIEYQHNIVVEQKNQLKEHNLNLEVANAKIQESTRLKETFLTNMSHEIRTPLNAITGYANLLLTTDLSEKQFNYLRSLKHGASNLLVLINDILDLSKIEAGKMRLEKIDFNLNEILENFLDTISVKAKEKEIELTMNISFSEPKILKGDPYRLTQIMNNLVGNAIKFTPDKGFITIQIHLLEKKEKSYKIRFEIQDSGIGIAKEKQKVIFENFAQASVDTTRQFGGSGVGLSIVKQLVEMQNGEINLISDTGKGSLFWFEIVFEEGDYNYLNSSKIQENIRISKNSKLNILLVEDNPVNREIAIDTLLQHNENIKIDEAENGKIAVKKVLQGKYNLIIMDIQMPELDGYEATKIIRKKLPKPLSDTPILGMSAHAMQSEKDKCLQLGMNDYIAKPFEPALLFRKIAELTGTAEIVENKIEQKIVSEYKFINLKNLPSIYNQNESKRLKMLKMCNEHIPISLENLNLAFSTKDWKAVEKNAHSVKNLLYYLGLEEESKILKEIEHQAKEKPNYSILIQMLHKIRKSWEGSCVELETIIKKLENDISLKN